MDYLPIYIDLRAQPCLVVGGGAVAARKIDLLLQAGAQVLVVAKQIDAELRALAAAGSIALLERGYESSDVEGKRLVLAATDDGELNARVAADAQARAIPVNVVDSPALCSFIMPAIIDRSPVLVAVSTAGASPVLARTTRARIEAALPHGLGALARFAARHRAEVKRRIADGAARREFWEHVLEGEIGALVVEGRAAEAEAALGARLALGQAREGVRVALVASGDGDPDQLTLRAARALGSADALLFESRALRCVRALGRRDAEFIDVGALGEDGWSWTALALEAAARARRGQRVCVVRAGDPYAAAAEAQDASALRAAGVESVIMRPGA